MINYDSLLLLLSNNIIWNMLYCRAGVKVKGYFAWTLLDDFEWSRGYTMRFGITYIDFKSTTLKRIPKLSSKWFTHFLRS